MGGLDPISVDVRIIAATNRNLEEMVEHREFRGDLYYRLSVIPVFIPPLRERKQDIMLLIEHFLTKYSQMLGRKRPVLDDLTLKTLFDYYWPGNVRELQNTIEYAINMCEGDQSITLEHLPQRIFASDSEAKASSREYRVESRESKAGTERVCWESQLIEQMKEDYGETSFIRYKKM